MKTCYNCGEVGHTKNRFLKLYNKVSQIGQFAHVAYASEKKVPEVYLYQMKSLKNIDCFNNFRNSASAPFTFCPKSG